MRIVLALTVVLFSSFLAAEDSVRSNVRTSAGDSSVLYPQPLTAHQMVRDSALIFAGTVLNIDHSKTRSGNEAGITTIRFRVQNAIRGVRTGQIVEVREWGGLWNTGERYQRGENVLLFLYPASKLGLTSPVGGSAGRFQVDNTWRVRIGNASPLPRPVKSRNRQLTVREFAAVLRRETKE